MSLEDARTSLVNPLTSGVAAVMGLTTSLPSGVDARRNLTDHLTSGVAAVMSPTTPRPNGVDARRNLTDHLTSGAIASQAWSQCCSVRASTVVA
jgi:hypothetical protein